MGKATMMGIRIGIKRSSFRENSNRIVLAASCLSQALGMLKQKSLRRRRPRRAVRPRRGR